MHEVITAHLPTWVCMCVFGTMTLLSVVIQQDVDNQKSTCGVLFSKLLYERVPACQVTAVVSGSLRPGGL